MRWREIRTGVQQAWPGLALVAAGLVVVLIAWPPHRADLELETKSAYSHIRIRREGNTRTLLFVRDDGREFRQSRFNLDAPHELNFAYTRAMFASYLFQPQQERVLIVGLGGGSMVRFLQHHEPQLQVDVVEIDAVIVRLADEYFATRSSDRVNIVTADGFEYLGSTDARYDVIYFDAFLKPSAETDATGVPRRLKTIAFYQEIQQRLETGGVVVFNLNAHADTDEDIRTIAAAFAETAVFACGQSTNVVVVATTQTTPTEPSVLAARATACDARFGATFSFRDILADRLQ